MPKEKAVSKDEGLTMDEKQDLILKELREMKESLKIFKLNFQQTHMLRQGS